MQVAFWAIDELPGAGEVVVVLVVVNRAPSVVVEFDTVEFMAAAGLTIKCTGDATNAVASPIAIASMNRLTGFIGE
ncbi:hypothetical protein [Caldivirga sp.]|uniref:hypothetical protein n=1 Tax=Caldivirga sp. TaxID=2080243 RepID=UPI0025C6A743|nr:hypothetical protein [Caldivirga sp.]